MIRMPVLPAFLLLLSVSLFTPAPPVTAQPQWSVELAPEWTALLDTQSGWTGADGIFSIPINGDETPGGADTRRTQFVFSDTFVGEVNDDGERLPGTTMINNTLGWMPPGGPQPGPLHFWYRGIAEEDPGSVFVPDTPNSQPGDYYWPGDGIVIGNAVYYLASLMYSTDTFHQRGVTMLRVPLNSRPPMLPYQQWDVPLFVPAQGDRGDIAFIGGILPNTTRAGAPNPDGYIYIYGHESVWLNKYLLVARVPEAQFPYVAQWEFWDGDSWSPDIHDAARMTDQVSPENSVTPLPDGRFLLVFQYFTIGPEVAVRIGETPHGPWSEHQVIYVTPEPELYPNLDIYTYNAKAHPHLSEPGELLISYNVNCNGFWTHFDYADIYRPRFLKLISPLLP